jgi:HK97 family phage major capsid protein
MKVLRYRSDRELEDDARVIAQFMRGVEQSKTDDVPLDANGYLGMSRRDIEAYSMLRAIAWKTQSIAKRLHGASGTDLEGVEAECHKALVTKVGEPIHQGTLYTPTDVLYHRRDLTVASAGAVVGTAIGSFIDMLKNKSVTDKLGVQRIPNQREHLTWAKQTGGPTIVWQTNESTPATESTPAFEEVAATPKTAVAYHEVSRQATAQISPAAEQLFRSALADGIALGGDQATLSGSGAAGQPLGIINTPGIGSVVGTSIDYAKLVEFQTDVSDNNAALNPATMGYVCPPLVASLLKGRQRFTGTDSPLWRGAIVEGEIEGCRAMSSKQMPASTLLFGDWSTVAIVEWGVLAIEVNPFADFKAGIIGIRALWSMDVLVTQPLAFSVATSIT